LVVRDSLDCFPTSLSTTARRSEIAAILVAGIFRLKSRMATLDSEIDDDPAESQTACLEVSPEIAISVTNVINDQ
jgi:hypothetical protein